MSGGHERTTILARRLIARAPRRTRDPTERRHPPRPHTRRHVRPHRPQRARLPLADRRAGLALRRRARRRRAGVHERSAERVGAARRRDPLRDPHPHRYVAARARAGPAHDLHEHVPARRDHAPRLEHAVPLDLREQRRGRARPRPVRRVLPRLRRRRGARADGRVRGERRRLRADGRRQRRDRGGARRLHDAVPARARALRDHHLHLRPARRGARVVLHRALVRAADTVGALRRITRRRGDRARVRVRGGVAPRARDGPEIDLARTTGAAGEAAARCRSIR